jgi:hypothetical protein
MKINKDGNNHLPESCQDHPDKCLLFVCNKTKYCNRKFFALSLSTRLQVRLNWLPLMEWYKPNDIILPIDNPAYTPNEIKTACKTPVRNKSEQVIQNHERAFLSVSEQRLLFDQYQENKRKKKKVFYHKSATSWVIELIKYNSKHNTDF